MKPDKNLIIRFATLNKTQPYATKSKRKRRFVSKKNVLITMTTIVVIMMMVDDMEEYNDKDAWFVYFFNLYNQDDHGQVRSCKPVEVPSTQKVCHQVPHQACHQVSFVATLLVFRCHQFVIVPIPITLPICLCHSSHSFPPNSPTL